MCPLTNCHIWLIFATPLMGDEPPPPEWQPICVLTHMANIGPPIRAPSIFVCVVCLKPFRIGLSNFAYLFHIIHNISNTCQSVAYLPITQQASPLPRQYLQTQDNQPQDKQPKVCLEKKLIFCFELKKKLAYNVSRPSKQQHVCLKQEKMFPVQKLSKIKI